MNGPLSGGRDQSLEPLIAVQKKAFDAERYPSVAQRRNRIDRLIELVLSRGDDLAETMRLDFRHRSPMHSLLADGAALAADGAHVILRESVELATIHYGFPRTAPIPDRMIAELVMAGFLRLARQLAGATVRARIASFEHPRPPYHAECTRLFDGAERFAQSSTFIAFEREILDRPQLHQSPDLYNIVRAEAERSLRSVAGNVGPTERVRRYLLAHPVARMPDMATAARDLGMSERSLRRQLASENVSYREIVRATLEDCAGHMLRDPARTIQETAIALGFVDASSFHRAFKTWTGMTPKQYRNARGGP